MKILDGKELAKKIKLEIAHETSILVAQGKIPHLAAILVGNDGASETYVASKVKDCKQVGFKSSLFHFEKDIPEQELLNKIIELNNDKEVDGILVQLPLPHHISVDKVTGHIDPFKDVDGFHPENIGRMVKNMRTYISATPLGIMIMLEKEGIPTEGKHCVVLGRSHIVGTPMSILMARNAYPGNATVTLCHSKTKNLEEITRQADILIVALGKPDFVKADMIKPGAVVIDVGITRVDDKNHPKGFRIKGDVAFDEVAPLCSYISPVPGGVGPMTRIGLLQNTLLAAKLHFSEKH